MEADETPKHRRSSPRKTRLRWRVFGLCVATELASFGCGDGVGRPLRAELSGSGGSGSGLGGSTLGAEAGAATGGTVDVPLSSHCEPADGWSDEFAEFEESLLSLINTARAFGTSCETGERGERVQALTMQKELRCSARLHVRDMAENDFYDRVNRQGETPESRMVSAGAQFDDCFEILVASEVLFPPEQAAVAAFLEILSEEWKCENALDDRFSNVGIGYYEDIWTIDLSGP